MTTATDDAKDRLGASPLRCPDNAATHYVGCPCHEAAWAEKLAAAESRLSRATEALREIEAERAAREKAERERDEARDNLKLVKWTPNDDRMMEMLVAEKERDEYGARLARVEAALLSLAKVGEDDDGQPVLRISCGFHCETADMAELPLVWAALAEIGGKR